MVRRTHGACVTSVLCARVVVCKAQSSERGCGSGEAKPGARHASLLWSKQKCAFCLLWSKIFLLWSKERKACIGGAAPKTVTSRFLA